MANERTHSTYNKEIEELRKELKKFKDEQITMSSLKNLHQHHES